MMFNRWVERRMSHRDAARLDGPEHSGPTRAIVVGYGRFGQTVAQMLMAKEISVTLIDSKPSQIELAGNFGMKVYYGDGLRVDLLRLAGAAEAQAIFFCTDKGNPARHRLEAILEAFPQAAVFVRAFDRRHLIDLATLDLAGAVRELFESAVDMGRQGLALLGVEQSEIDRVDKVYRDRDLDRLEGQTASGDLHTMKETMFGPDNPIGAAGETKAPAAR
jgi:voltage-gated potassium channel Kch